jgi:hypothetical protein
MSNTPEGGYFSAYGAAPLALLKVVDACEAGWL